MARFEDVLPSLRDWKRVRRKAWDQDRYKSRPDSAFIDMDDIFADDWEIEPEKRELSREDIEKAWRDTWNASDLAGRGYIDLEAFLRELGFGEEK